MPSDRRFLIVINISFKIILNMAFLLSHDAERSMGNIFRVPHILQHISNKQVEVRTASTNLNLILFLFAYFNSSICIPTCSLFICLILNGLLRSICFRMFCSKHSITFEKTYLLSCWFTVLIHLTLNVDYVNFSRKWVPWLEFYWLKHYKFRTVYTCMF